MAHITVHPTDATNMCKIRPIQTEQFMHSYACFLNTRKATTAAAWSSAHGLSMGRMCVRGETSCVDGMLPVVAPVAEDLLEVEQLAPDDLADVVAQVRRPSSMSASGGIVSPANTNANAVSRLVNNSVGALGLSLHVERSANDVLDAAAEATAAAAARHVLESLEQLLHQHGQEYTF